MNIQQVTKAGNEANRLAYKLRSCLCSAFSYCQFITKAVAFLPESICKTIFSLYNTL